MKESVKAALWSIFIFPGSGHFFLRKPMSGSVFVGLTLVALSVVLVKIVERSMEIVDQILLGEIPYDPLVIAEMVSRQSALNQSQLLDITWYVMIFLWIAAAIDAYRLGRIRKSDQGKNHSDKIG